MLRANSGKTSSGETCWLMAAMRRKERRGPGIKACSEVASVAALEDVSCPKARAEEGAPAPQTSAHILPNTHTETVRKNAGRQRRSFMAKNLHPDLVMVHFRIFADAEDS